MVAEAPDAAAGRVQPLLHLLRQADAHADVPGRGRQLVRDQLQVEHVVVFQRLDGIGHHVGGLVDVVAVLPDAPAQLQAVVLADDTVAAGFLLAGAAGVPDVVAGQRVTVADHGEVLDLDVAQVGAGEVPLGDPVAGVDVPALLDEGGAGGEERHVDGDVADPLLTPECGKGQDQCRKQTSPASHR